LSYGSACRVEYVLNVAHEQFVGVRVANSEPFSFDERLRSARRQRSFRRRELLRSARFPIFVSAPARS
jgi:hypothetical protein